MSEDNGQDRAVRGYLAAIRQVEQIERMIRDSEPLMRQTQRVESIVRDSEAVRRQVEPVIQAAEQFVRSAHWAKTGGGFGLPLPLRLAVAVNVEFQELAPAARDVIIVVDGDVATATETASVRVVQDSARGNHERSIGQILALVLVAIVASGLMGVQGPDRPTVDHYLTVMGIALPIALLIWNKRNKPK